MSGTSCAPSWIDERDSVGPRVHPLRSRARFSRQRDHLARLCVAPHRLDISDHEIGTRRIKVSEIVPKRRWHDGPPRFDLLRERTRLDVSPLHHHSHRRLDDFTARLPPHKLHPPRHKVALDPLLIQHLHRDAVARPPLQAAPNLGSVLSEHGNKERSAESNESDPIEDHEQDSDPHLGDIVRL